MTATNLPTTSSVRRIDQWFDEYAVCHQNPANKLIHYVCVSAIVASVLGLMWAIPMPDGFASWVNVATVVVALSMLFYLRLSPVLAIGLLIPTLPLLALFHWISSSANPALLWQLSSALFVVAWIFQLIGHKIEKAKPALADDLRFLLIGPIWILAKFFRLLGIRC